MPALVFTANRGLQKQILEEKTGRILGMVDCKQLMSVKMVIIFPTKLYLLRIENWFNDQPILMYYGSNFKNVNKLTPTYQSIYYLHIYLYIFHGDTFRAGKRCFVYWAPKIHFILIALWYSILYYILLSIIIAINF